MECMGSLDSTFSLGDNICRISDNKEVTVYRMQDMTGDGHITCFHVLPGIDLMYNDFHMQKCYSYLRSKVEMIVIDHCCEGRIEWEFENRNYLYLQEGDLQITTKERRDGEFGFPLNHYHGVTVAVYIEEATKMLANVIGGIPVNLIELKQKFCADNKPFIMRTSDSVQHIFSELYHIPDKIRIPYFRLKVLELLLFLSDAPILKGGEERPYFSKVHVETTKNMMIFMTDNLECHHTLDDLSQKFHISLTSMKNCFKGIYGTSIYAYMRTYRMNTASYELRQTNKSITEIAANVGYSNPSKFSAAFKDVVGISPLKYRKTHVRLE